MIELPSRALVSVFGLLVDLDSLMLDEVLDQGAVFFDRMLLQPGWAVLGGIFVLNTT